MTRHIALGQGHWKIGLVRDREGRNAILLTPLVDPEPVGKLLRTGGIADVQPCSVMIWGDTLEGVRVLQDAVNALALKLGGKIGNLGGQIGPEVLRENGDKVKLQSATGRSFFDISGFPYPQGWDTRG